MSGVWLCSSRCLLLLLMLLMFFASPVPGADNKDGSKPGETATKCFDCSNYDNDGKYYDQCPMNGKVDATRAYVEQNCTQHQKCFIHTDDLDPKRVYRGCTQKLYGLPKPLPPDGCYPWYSEVWCVCSTDLCNEAKLATPTTTDEFDAHIQKSKPDGPGNSSARLQSLDVHLLYLLVFTVASGQY